MRRAPAGPGWAGYPLHDHAEAGWRAVVVGEVAVGGPGDLAAAALARLRAEPQGCEPPDVPGHWALVAVSPEGLVHVMTDRFATVHVHVATGAAGTAVSTLASAAEAAAGLPGGAEGLDWEAIAGWCALGFYVGDRTQRAGLRVVRPATHVRVEASGVTAERRRWDWAPAPDHSRSVAATVGDLDDLLAEVLDGHAAGTRLAVPVSGGLDSRTTVAVLTRPGGPRPDLWAYSYGYGRDSVELAVAARVGAARGLPVEQWTVAPYLLDHLDRAAAALEGAQDLTQTRQLGVVDRVAAHAGAVVAAHWGDVWLDTTGVDVRGPSRPALRDALVAKFSKPGGWLLDHLVAPHLDRPPAEVVRDLVDAELGPYQELGDADWAAKAFKTDQWSFRWTVPSLRAYHAGLVPRLPFYDSRLADWALTVPPALHAGRGLQVELLRRRAPDLARVPWEVTGRPLAGDLAAGDRAALAVRRAARGARRLAGRPAVVRSWEVQLRGPRHRPALDRLLRGPGSPLHGLVDDAAVGALLDDLGGRTPPPAVGYPASMLVTLAAELGRRP